MVAWQQVRDRLSVVTLGSAGVHPDTATWGFSLLKTNGIYTLYDNDAAGEKGRQAVRALTSGKSLDLRLPGYAVINDGVINDVNDFVLAGGLFWEQVLKPAVDGLRTMQAARRCPPAGRLPDQKPSGYDFASRRSLARTAVNSQMLIF